MSKRVLLLAALITLAVPTAQAQAQASNADQKAFQVTGDVPALCSSGSVTGGDSTFALGVLIDTATGAMLPNLAAQPKTLTGAFCNSPSTITISATPMHAQAATATPPDGFTNALDYTATASGWTAAAASFATNAASNAAAAQSRDAAYAGVITVGVSAFSPVGGASLRPVADPSYQGVITLTLAVAG